MSKFNYYQQNKYAKILRSVDKNTYDAYKRMTSNNNTSRISTRSQTDWCPSSGFRSSKDNKKISYTNFIAKKAQQQQQSLCPFGFTEKRFKWQNLNDKSNLINVNDKAKGKKQLKRKSSFDGGFLDFYNRQKAEIESNKPYRFQKKNANILRKTHSQDHSRNRNLMMFDSQRVIQPELNVRNIYI
jgi:hypothetical protein